MPQQQQRKPSFEELLQGAPPAPSPTPGRAPSFEELLQQPTPTPGPTFEQLLSQQPQPQEDFLTRFRRNIGIGYEQGKAALSGAVDTVSEAGREALRGNFKPALEALELGARGGLAAQAAVLTGGNVGAFRTASQSQAPAIQRLNAEREARRLAGPDANHYRGVANERARLEAEANRDPSLTGRITRGVVSGGVQALPTIAAGALTGGSAPVIAATSALSALGEPENAPLAGAAAVLPIPVGQAARAGLNAIRRTLGRGAEQIVEAEAGQAGGALVRTGAVVDQAALRAASPSAGLNAAIAEGAQEVSRPLAQRIGSEVASLYNVPRALVASADVSAPLRQGALLTLPPSQWGRAAAAGVRMFEAFSTKRYNRIVEEIAAHPDSQIAQRAGLHLSTQAKEGLKKSEEDFVSKYAGRIPLVKQSQQAYESYLDSLRLSTFSKYKALIDKRNIPLEAKQKAYREAARWLNISGGRGTLGETLDKGMDALNNILFAPRFLASRINILDPRTYTRNLSTEGGRVILRQQMSELFQAASVLASTAALAKAAGAEVSLSPSSPDFLKIKFGNRRLDLLAGEQQVMRLIYRVGAAVTRNAQGEKSKPGEGALDVSARFLRSKLAPIPSYFVDFLTRKTYTGQDFNAAKGVAQRVAPLVWQDFLEAYQKEGFAGVAATTPALFGAGVQLYTQPGSFLDTASPLLREYTRAQRQLPEIHRIKGEADEQFNARVKVFGEALQQYGVGLVQSDEYRQASQADKDAMLNLLPRRISSALLKSNETWQLAPRVLASDVRENLQLRRELQRQQQLK